MSLTLNLGGSEHIIRNFRDEAHGFESFQAYIAECVAPIMRFLPEISTIRCSTSGVPVAISTINEIEDCIATGIRNAHLERFNDLVHTSWTDQGIIDEIESLVDDVSIRMILSWRKSPSLTIARDGSVIAAVAPQKQLAILLGLFLFLEDRRQNRPIEDEIGTRRRQSSLADSIALTWASEPMYGELLNSLIELDAKYRITKIRLNKKELQSLHDILSMSDFDATVTNNLVRSIIAWRDEYAPELYSDGIRTWTQDAWRKINADMQARERYSNLLEEPKIVLNGKEYKVPTNPEDKEKLDKKIQRVDILKSIFGNLGGMGA